MHLGSDPNGWRSLANESYQQAPPDFKKVRPLKERQELLATNYELGQSVVEYQSQTMDNYRVPNSRPVQVQPRFKNYNKRIDIITGEILNNNYKKSGYEAYTESNQHRISGNQSYLPADTHVQCPITGRVIIKK